MATDNKCETCKGYGYTDNPVHKAWQVDPEGWKKTPPLPIMIMCPDCKGTGRKPQGDK